MVFRSCIIILLFCSNFVGAQSPGGFLKPADTLNNSRLNAVVITGASATVLTYVALDRAWYSEYPRSGFHFRDDSAQWLQMDKAGHAFSTYHISRFASDALEWSGVGPTRSSVYGSAFGVLFISGVEVLDGFSKEWGASPGDLGANMLGGALFLGQELLWKEQRIVLKYSFHTTPYAAVRPGVLGKTLPEQVLKDYNGQTYWLSGNLRSFTGSSLVPNWLNIAIGYGAEGMITGSDDFVNTIFLPERDRIRQYYLSFDIDLSRIKTRSELLTSLFSVFNTIKVPAPTFELRSDGVSKFRLFYF